MAILIELHRLHLKSSSLQQLEALRLSKFEISALAYAWSDDSLCNYLFSIWDDSYSWLNVPLHVTSDMH